MYVPSKHANGKRRYGAWAGNERGYPEDKMCCIAAIQDPVSRRFYQCLRNRGHGPDGEYCKQHAAKVEQP